MKTITLDKFCEETGISRRNASRKIRKGELRPQIIKSKQGTREYRFDEYDISAFLYTEHQKVEGKNTCYLCGSETGYSDEELKEAIKLMLNRILDAWQNLQLKNKD